MKHRVLVLIGLSGILLSGCYMGWGHHHGDGWDDNHHHDDRPCSRYETVNGQRRCADSS